VFPRVSGHELVGHVVALGDRVGGAWHGGHDGACAACRRGQFQMCDAATQNGRSHDGGWAEYVLLNAEAAVRVPRDMDPTAAVPLLCAGVTVFNAMRKMHAEQGALVVVQGLGGLGHLVVQYASRMGYRVVALSRGGKEKRAFATKMGAHEFVDTSDGDGAAELQAMGGAALICRGSCSCSRPWAPSSSTRRP
jgi:D-arabinose 1-dehydrogenase-like Zn-dependent alcohol dehydrogenase